MVLGLFKKGGGTPGQNMDDIRANWRCFLACGAMLVSPFQYGLDFGLIGGLQAMKGFLQVRRS